MSKPTEKSQVAGDPKPNIPFSERLGVSVEEIAEAFGVSKPTIQDAINDGELPSFRFGRRRIVRPAAAIEFAEKREAKCMAELTGGAA